MSVNPDRVSSRPATSTRPFFSVVVPVHNGEATLAQCLSALRGSRYSDFELLVVDDGSTDGSVRIAEEAGARVLHTGAQKGPAAARNLGAARAVGEFLLFIDADCGVGSQTIAEAAAILCQDPGLDALFGSYDDRPSAPGLVARFKNLQHHYVHQHGADEAGTFWAGCGAMRRSVFLRLGGFDEARYPRPSIEDIELGYRLTAVGGRIRLAKDVQVKHHKAWSLAELLRTDLLHRGIPWIVLLAQTGRSGSDLNLQWRGRLSVVVAVLAVLGLLTGPMTDWGWALAAVSAILLVLLNVGFYRLLSSRGGLALLCVGMGLHWLYQLNCALAFAVGRSIVWKNRVLPGTSGESERSGSQIAGQASQQCQDHEVGDCAHQEEAEPG